MNAIKASVPSNRIDAIMINMMLNGNRNLEYPAPEIMTVAGRITSDISDAINISRFPE
jgi:hypothetical protein